MIWSAILTDLDRYRFINRRPRLWVLFSVPGAQAGFVYRIGHWLYTGPPSYLALLLPLRIIYWLMARWIDITTGISLNPLARIGPGLYIGHYGCVVVGGGVKIGSNCNISQGVTLGVGGRGTKRGSPIVGNRVYIAPGAKIFGAIEIGDDVAIGANAVVVKSVPDRAVVGGIPASVISFAGSFDFVHYPRMDHDNERQVSLKAR